MKYWIHNGGKIVGPFSGSQLKRLAQTGELKPNHKVSVDQKKWSVAQSVKGLVFPNEKTDADSNPKLPAQTDTKNSPTQIECETVFEEAKSRHVEYESDGKPVKSDIGTVRSLLLDGKLTGRESARWVEPKPVDAPWYDWRESSNPGKWKTRRQWRPIEDGIGKEAFHLRLLFDARTLVRELTMYGGAVVALLVMVPFTLYMDVIVLIDTDSVLAPDTISFGSNDSAPAIWIVKVIAFWVVSIVMLPMWAALGALLLGWPLGTVAYVCVSGFLPKLPGQQKEGGSRQQRKELVISISAISIIAVALAYWVLVVPSREDVYEQIANRVLSEDPCRVDEIDGPIYRGLPPLTELRKFLDFDGHSKDPLIGYIVQKHHPNSDRKLAFFRGAVVLLGQHGPAAQSTVDDILASIQKSIFLAREREHARKMAEALVAIDSNVYDRIFRTETRDERTLMNSVAIEVFDLSADRVVQHVRDAEESELTYLTGKIASVILYVQRSAIERAPESNPYASTLAAMATAIAARMEDCDSFDSDYGKTCLPFAVRLAPQAVGKRYLDRFANGTEVEFPHSYQKNHLPSILIRVPDSFPILKRAFLDGRYFPNPSGESNADREFEIRSGILGAARNASKTLDDKQREQKIILENVKAMVPLLEKVKSGELQFPKPGGYHRYSLPRYAHEILALLE